MQLAPFCQGRKAEESRWMRSVSRALPGGDVGGVVEAHGPVGSGHGGRQQLHLVEGIGCVGDGVFPKNAALDGAHSVAFHQAVALPGANAESG